ncbi:MAG TPA: MFS transporter, partial [Azospirillaceae bacterium]|nr:MFS transporter [Azospirillaceae bacterium]
MRRAPAGVLALGFVSMLMDTSSEMIHSLLPLFMVGALGLGPLAVGLIDGLSEAAAALVKIWSGVLSDRLGRRKPLALAGYGLGALSKPLFPLAASAGAVFAARFIDRIGKGIRGAPRDALVADMTPPDQRGAAYGLRQAVDNLGAVIGPLAAMALMAAFNDDYRTVFWLAVIPAFLSVAVLAIAVKEPPPSPEQAAERARRRGKRWRFHHLRRLPAAFWVLTAAAAVMVAARFSEAFLLLRAADVGMAAALTPLALVAMNVVYAAAAYPAGVWTDGRGRGRFGVL